MRAAAVVAGRVPALPAEAYRWWTAYGEDDHASHAFRPFRWGRRQILARHPDGRVERFRDAGRALGLDTTYESVLRYGSSSAAAWARGRALDGGVRDGAALSVFEASEGPVGTFDGEYAFLPHVEGCLLVWSFEGALAPGAARRYAALPGFVRALAAWDLHGHLRDLRRDLGRRRRAPFGVPVDG